ncbi:MAG: glycosyltransferase [Patescibacteria group bacterium]|jgi:phosphatidylinositol alpha-1,6-mannosyltransferase
MRKTLFLTEEYPPQKGGVGRFIHQLVQCVPQQYVHIIAPYKKNTLYPKGVIMRNFHSRFIWPHWIATLLSVLKFSRTNAVEHIVVSSVLPLGLIAYVLRYILKIPYTVVVVGMDILHIQNKRKKSWVAKKVLHKADSIIAISHFTKNNLALYKVSESKILIIHPSAFCTPETFKPIISPEIQKFISGKKLILSVGRLVKRKNFHTIIRIAKTFEHRKNVVFVISGNGPERDTLRTQIANLGIKEKILIIQANDTELAGLYTQSSCVLFIPTSTPDGDVEGFGIVGVEAASFGVPTVASNQGGVPDAVADGISGNLVDPANEDEIERALKKILDDTDYCQRMRLSARHFYEKYFTKDLQREKFVSLLGAFSNQDISVVIPAFNAEKTISTCLTSLKQQSHTPLEVIVVDDGSKDDTAQIITEQYPWVKLIRQKNSGAPVARNAGAKVAKGDFIIFLDSDIECKPRMLEIMKRVLLYSHNISYVYSRFSFGWKKFPSFHFDEHLLRKHNYIHTSSLMRKKDFVGFDESLKRHQDWDLWLTMLENGKKGILIEEYLYKIHLEKNRISSWVPSFFYSLPILKQMRTIQLYEQSADQIKRKHGLI